MVDTFEVGKWYKYNRKDGRVTPPPFDGKMHKCTLSEDEGVEFDNDGTVYFIVNSHWDEVQQPWRKKIAEDTGYLIKPVTWHESFGELEARPAFGLSLTVRYNTLKGRFHWYLQTQNEDTLAQGSCVLQAKAIENCEKAYVQYVVDNLDKCVEKGE